MLILLFLLFILLITITIKLSKKYNQNLKQILINFFKVILAFFFSLSFIFLLQQLLEKFFFHFNFFSFLKNSTLQQKSNLILKKIKNKILFSQQQPFGEKRNKTRSELAREERERKKILDKYYPAGNPIELTIGFVKTVISQPFKLLFKKISPSILKLNNSFQLQVKQFRLKLKKKIIAKNKKTETKRLNEQKQKGFFQAKYQEERLLKEKEKERLENERLELERLENERLENERLELERLENERLELERLELERLEKEKNNEITGYQLDSYTHIESLVARFNYLNQPLTAKLELYLKDTYDLGLITDDKYLEVHNYLKEEAIISKFQQKLRESISLKHFHNLLYLLVSDLTEDQKYITKKLFFDTDPGTQLDLKDFLLRIEFQNGNFIIENPDDFKRYQLLYNQFKFTSDLIHFKNSLVVINARLKELADLQNEALKDIKSLPKNERKKEKNKILKNFFELNGQEIHDLLFRINGNFNTRVAKSENYEIYYNEKTFKKYLLLRQKIFLKEEKEKEKKNTKVTEKNGKEEIEEKK